VKGKKKNGLKQGIRARAMPRLTDCSLRNGQGLAQHTVSIVAVNTAPGGVGSVGASWVRRAWRISEGATGRGAGHTQAIEEPYDQSVAQRALEAGLPPPLSSIAAGAGQGYIAARPRPGRPPVQHRPANRFGPLAIGLRGRSYPAR
jgi:hypothetical protein